MWCGINKWHRMLPTSRIGQFKSMKNMLNGKLSQQIWPVYSRKKSWLWFWSNKTIAYWTFTSISRPKSVLNRLYPFLIWISSSREDLVEGPNIKNSILHSLFLTFKIEKSRSSRGITLMSSFKQKRKMEKEKGKKMKQKRGNPISMLNSRKKAFFWSNLSLWLRMAK